jgi:hypothetical protein
VINDHAGVTKRETQSKRDEAVVAATGLWDEHLRADFPARLRGEEIAGVDMVMVDSDVAGCVITFLKGRGVLDEWRRGILRGCIRDLDKVLPLLTDDEERRYYGRIREVASLVSGTPG